MFKKTLVCGALALTCIGAFAQQKAYYIEGAIGQSTNSASGSFAGNTSEKKSDSGSKVLFGFQSEPSYAFEVGYYNYGKYKATFSSVTKTVGLSGLVANVVFTGNQDKLSYKAGLGFGSLTAKYEVSDGSYSASKKSFVVPTLTAGLGYEVAKDVSVMLNYDYASAKYPYSTTVNETITANMISLGLRVKF